uniref:Arylacetamide deacetylase-like 4 n=1 Tax=Cyprinus carpio TaxID=7962 RepID=A0A8C2JC43_CYPCA
CTCSSFCLLVVVPVYLELRNVNIPPGVANPWKLCVTHCVYVGISFVVSVNAVCVDLTFNGVSERVYEPTTTSGEKKKGLLYFHGGGWVVLYISLESDTTVVSVGYRLAPKHRYPTLPDDCEVMTCHLLSIAAADFGVDPRRVAVGGESAGANLAAYPNICFDLNVNNVCCSVSASPHIVYVQIKSRAHTLKNKGA